MFLKSTLCYIRLYNHAAVAYPVGVQGAWHMPLLISGYQIKGERKREEGKKTFVSVSSKIKSELTRL